MNTWLAYVSPGIAALVSIIVRLLFRFLKCLSKVLDKKKTRYYNKAQIKPYSFIKFIKF